MIINDIVVVLEPKETMTVTLLTTTTLEDIRFYATKKPTTTPTPTWTRRRTDARSAGASGKRHGNFIGNAGAESKTERLLPLETKELVDALREESADAVLTDNRDEDENTGARRVREVEPDGRWGNVCHDEIYRRDKGGGGGFDVALLGKEEEGGILAKNDGVLGGSGE